MSKKKKWFKKGLIGSVAILLSASIVPSSLVFAETVDSAVKLRRENDRIYIIGAQQIFQYLPDNPHLKTVFHAPKATNVDKNSSAYFEIRGNNVYLYPLK